MRRKKSLLLRMIPWIIMIAAIAALIVFVGIPLYGQQETETENPPVMSYYDGDENPMIMENDHLVFEMDAKTTGFSITEKDTGRIWKSTPENAAKRSYCANQQQRYASVHASGNLYKFRRRSDNE